jgi:hypothetical protein
VADKIIDCSRELPWIIPFVLPCEPGFTIETAQIITASTAHRQPRGTQVELAVPA